MLLVISAPSGAGKSTLVRRLLEARDDFRLSVSHTSRAPRPGEVDGEAYYFVSEDAFREIAAEGGFVEWFEVHGNLYGTSRAEVERLRRAGYHVAFDVDVQGGMAIRRAYPEAVSVFVVPPSMAELEARLRGRGTESDEVVRRRLANARGEMERARDYDYLVVNDDLDRAVADIVAIAQGAPLSARFRSTVIETLLNEASQGRDSGGSPRE